MIAKLVHERGEARYHAIVHTHNGRIYHRVFNAEQKAQAYLESFNQFNVSTICI